MKRTDFTGRVIGRLTVLSREGSRWSCVCSCGGKKSVSHACLIKKHCWSCGCLLHESRVASGESTRTHGMRHTRQYRIWKGLLERCRNPNSPDYQAYGGRGIEHDPKWGTFSGFWSDMEPGYSDDLQIDRINNDGPYTRENCRWVTGKEQQRNKRSNRRIETPFGRLIVPEISEITGIPKGCLYRRLKHMARHRFLEPKRIWTPRA